MKCNIAHWGAFWVGITLIITGCSENFSRTDAAHGQRTEDIGAITYFFPYNSSDLDLAKTGNAEEALCAKDAIDRSFKHFADDPYPYVRDSFNHDAIEIIGYADGNNNAYNQGLALHRAAATRDYLIAKGIASQRITLLAKVLPVEKVACSSNNPTDCLYSNRRVEIRFIRYRKMQNEK